MVRGARIAIPKVAVSPGNIPKVIPKSVPAIRCNNTDKLVIEARAARKELHMNSSLQKGQI